MRTVIMLMLVSSCAFGQLLIHEPSLVFPNNNAMKIVLGGDTLKPNGAPLPSHIFRFVVVSEWDAYAAECFADSVARSVGVGNVVCLPTHPPIYKYDRYITVWEHRTPTIEGFIEFLRRRLK